MLNRAAIEGAKLDGAILKDANIFGVEIEKACYTNLDLAEAISVDDSAEAAVRIADLVMAHEQWVESSGAIGTRGDFSGMDLAGVDFTGRNLSAAIFVHARLRSTKFNKAILDLTDFTMADLTGASLAHADLRGANLSDAILRRANFSGADLKMQTAHLPNGMTREFPVSLRGCRFGETNFSGVACDRLKAAGTAPAGMIAEPEFRALFAASA